ncbi:sensor histidine kinase [Crocosphaera chwakensis]|uniref:Circadian input-output histidine kinase CikA n=1 Tax=Crocosphaera chwakensis CCY0110 TaxID=391612 RepID=A3IRI1_9CHRO|nr:HAMP domain-containing sensor histidine kinase [Crocosphaera chwakensis]EAZ90983.1 sensory transduction histidine kinase [Crocosphaera chwakensis CCY0110]
MSKPVYHQHWSQQLIRQIYCLLNSDLDLKEKIVDVLALIGEAYYIDNVVLLSIESSVCQIYKSWGVRDQKWLESFIYQQWFPLVNCKHQHQIYQFRQFHCCLLSLPLYISQKFFGYLILQTEQSERNFSPEEIGSLEIVTHQIAIAIQQIQLIEKLDKIQSDNQKLQSYSDHKSDYLSHVSHELRTPLAGILGFSKMLREEIYGTLNDKQKQYVNGIRISGEHLLALVNDFLDLSKIEANKEELFLETVAVEDICLAAISMVQPKADEQNLNLLLKLSDQVDFCKVDQRKIKQILINLLSNAIKFTEKGSVTLEVDKIDCLLTFCVVDTGIGIKEEDQQKLFQPFQQIHSNLSRKHKGTGLGLALSKKLAQLHQGDLTLQSEYGKGSCFTLELPLREVKN